MFGSYQMLINGIDFDIKQRKWYAEENDNKNPKQMRIIQSDSEFYNKYEPSNMLSEYLERRLSGILPIPKKKFPRENFLFPPTASHMARVVLVKMNQFHKTPKSSASYDPSILLLRYK